jgi:hypothetical protein
MRKRIKLIAIVALPAMAYGRGVSPYLPLNLDPEIERQIERVLILGGKPMLRRPIAAAQVLAALPKACKIDAALCGRVQKYLQRYMGQSGIEFASIEGSVGTGSNTIIPNQHGQSEQSHYQVAAAGYYQFSDYGLVNVGGVATQGESPTATPTGSMLSLGFDWAQLDIGYRDHWWSPTANSSMLISTEAPTMPGITLSNYRPISGLGIDYELFIARMSYSTQIETAPNGVLTQGYPLMTGLHFGLEPVSGWALGANRVLVFGGGAAGGQSITDVVDAFFDPSKAQSTGFGGGQAVVGKQEASVVSQMIFPGTVPFTGYVEYAGNDTSQGSNFLFGKPDLSFGLHVPRLGPFDLTLETSVWEPTWYVHGGDTVQTGYGDGISNDHITIGNWFGDQRLGGDSLLGDAVGGQTQLVRVGYEPHFGGRFEAQLRILRNDTGYSQIAFPYPYHREYMGSLSYAYPWRGYAIGGEVDVGQDVFGDHYARLAGFLRLGDALAGGGEADEQESSSPDDHVTTVFMDVGVNANKLWENIVSYSPSFLTPLGYGPSLGLGARRAVTDHQDLGMRLDVDDIDGRLMLGVRAIDYRYRFNGPLALDAFFGAASYSLGTPAIGWYAGAGPEWRNILPGWDLALTAREGIGLSRLRVLPTDPVDPNRNDSFYNVFSLALTLSHKL